MNLNDNNKAKSVKLNARNLQELQMETVTLTQESKEMEEKLQQLKESMSKEKEERGHSKGFRWKFGQCGSLNTNSITNSTKKNMENTLQKLSAGRVKIRVLKDEPLTASPQPLPPPLAPTTSLRTVRKNRLRGTICGQCEVKTAGLMCAECTENFCIGCFAKFHQKGALKLHRMIPIQTNLQTHVSTPDVINSFQKQIDHSLQPGTFTNLVPSPNFKSRCNPHHNFTSNTSPRNGDQNPEEGQKDVSQAMPFHPDPSQVLVMNRVGEKKVEVKEEGLKKKNGEDVPMSLLRGQYSEEESARSFQKALKQWRGEKSHPTGEPTWDSGIWKPVRPVSAIATQVDFRPDREIGEGRTSGGHVERIPVKVMFMENSLTYMDRLLLKEHRRTPIEPYTSLGLSKDFKFLSSTYPEEETANSLTAQEEDFRQYCSSLFAVPISRGRTEPEITTPESCLVIQVLDDTNRDINGIFTAVQRTDSDQNVPYVQWVSSKGRIPVPQASLPSGGSSSISLSPSIPTQPSRQSTIAAQTKAAQRLNPFKPQTSQAENLLTLMPSKSKTPACPTVETPRTSKTSIKTPDSKSQKPNFSPTVQKTKADLGSPEPLLTRSLLDCQTKITKFSHSLPLFSPDISPVHKDSSLLPEQTLEPESSELLPEPIASAKLSQFRLTNLEITSQSQHCLTSKPDLQQKYLESNSSSDLSLFNESTPPYEHASVFMSFTPMTGDHEPTLSNRFFPSLTSQLLNNIHIPVSAVKKEDVLSIDSADEISSDSLGLAPHEEDSSDEEAQMHRHIMRGGSRGEEQGNPAISHLGDSFVPADAEQEDLQTDGTLQLEDPSMVLHNQSAGPGLELFCDLHGFMPLGLDVNSVHSDTPEHTHCDPLHACQTSSHNSDPLVSKDHGSGSSFSVYPEEHLVFKMMDNVSHSATPTGGGEISANELRASGSNWFGRLTPTLFHPTMTTSSPIPASVQSSLSYSPSPPFCQSHPTLGSEMGPAHCMLSQAAQEIMEICCVDQTGCEDPDLDSDTSAHTIQSLEQELTLMAKEIRAHASVFGMGNSGSQDQRGTQHLPRVDEKQKEEEETKQKDRQSVLLLP